MNSKHRKHKYKIGDVVWTLSHKQTNYAQLSFSRSMIIGTETVMKNEFDWPAAQTTTGTPVSLSINTNSSNMVYCIKVVAVNYYKVLQDNIQTHLVKEDVVAKRLGTLKKRLLNKFSADFGCATSRMYPSVQVSKAGCGLIPPPHTTGGYPAEWLHAPDQQAQFTHTYTPQFVHAPYVPMPSGPTYTAIGQTEIALDEYTAYKLTNE